MAFTVTLYQFQKRKNSTLQPTALQGVELSCELKQPTSYKDPVFTFFVEAGFEWNYLQWDSWYYFITDVVSVRNNIFEVHCKLDVLATYKTEIGQTSAFVLYDTTANTEIVDSRLSQKTTAVHAVSEALLDYGIGYTVMLGIVGDDSVSVWGVTPYQASQLLNSINDWMDDKLNFEIPSGGYSFSDWDDAVNDVIEFVVQFFRQFIATGKAPDCIKSAVLLPVPASQFGGSSATIYLGEYDTKHNGQKIAQNAVANSNVSVSIPWQASDWRRNDNYTKIYVGLPYIGVVSYPASQLIGYTSLNVNYRITVNGGITCTVSAGGQRLGLYTGNCASNFMVGASNINPMQGMGAIVGGGGSALGVAAAASGAAAAAVGVAGIIGMINAVQQLPTCVGGVGGGAGADGWQVTCVVVYHDTNVDPSSVAAAIGTPTMAVQTIGTLSGFVQTKEASVNASCYEDVRTEINSLMDGGFFYE